MNVIPFDRKPPAHPVVHEIVIDMAQVAFMPLPAMRELLFQSIEWPDPLVFYEVMRATARVLMLSECSEAQAKAQGWADAETMRARGRDMDALLLELRRQIRIVPRNEGHA